MEMGPGTRYTLRRNSASIMKIRFYLILIVRKMLTSIRLKVGLYKHLGVFEHNRYCKITSS